MIKGTATLGLAASVLLLGGCKIDSSYQVYTADLQEVLETGEPLETNGRISIAMPSQDRCQEEVQRASEIIEKYFTVSRDAECREDGFDNYLSFGVKAPIVRGKSDLPNSATAGLSITQNDDLAVLYGYLDPGRFDSLQAEMKQINSQIDLEIGEVFVEVNNDLRDTVLIHPTAAWLDGTPALIGSAELDRRDQANLLLSDVFSAQLEDQNYAVVFAMRVGEDEEAAPNDPPPEPSGEDAPDNS